MHDYPVRLVAAYPLALFFVLAYAISWALFAPMVAAGTIVPGWIVCASFGPTIAAIATHRFTTGSYRAFRVVSGWPRVLLAAAISWTLVVMVFVVLPALVVTRSIALHWSVLGAATVFNASSLLGGPLGEEPGWRGYALPQLQARIGPVRATIIVGVLWAGWHLPLFFIPGWTSAPFWIYMLTTIGLSTILTLAVDIARLSVLPAIAGHVASLSRHDGTTQ